jgi:serine/threonine-protein phosphatase PGAM5
MSFWGSNPIARMYCSNNAVLWVKYRAMQFPPEAWHRMALNHGSITWISVLPSGRVVLRSLSDTGHMPPDAITVVAGRSVYVINK